MQFGHEQVDGCRPGRRVVRRVVFMCCIQLMATVAWSQPFLLPPQPAEATPADAEPAVEPPEPGHESEAETIAKCLRDLQSEDVKDRRRAVMVLGKYRTPQAMQGVTGALRDEDAEVRRSALVSASEWPVLPPNAVTEVLRLVQDDNVHVRRLASSMLPELVGGRPITITDNEGQVRMLQPPSGIHAKGPNRAVAEAVLNEALGDPDATVRRNVLAVAPYVSELLKRTALEGCLTDDDDEIRVFAVRAYARLDGEQAQRAQALLPLVDDPDTTVRREVARALGNLGPAAFPALEKLLDDGDPGVRLEAVRQLVEQQHPQGLRLLRQTVLDESLPAEERRDLARYAAFFRDDAKDLLEDLLKARSGLLRAEALRGLSRLPAYDNDAAFFLEFLDDESPEVREQASRVLATMAARSRREPGKASPFDASLATDLLGSDHRDVRELAVSLALYLQPDERLDVLVEACLDDDVEVRTQALRRLALLSDPMAFEIVVRSLDDPDTDVVIAAVQGLSSRPTEQTLKALKAFHQRVEEPSIKGMVAGAIQRIERSMAARNQPDQPAAPGKVAPRPTRPPIRPWPLPQK